MTFMQDWLPRIINFGILAGIIAYVVWKFPLIQNFFKNRTQEIIQSMQESRETRTKVLSDLAAMEQKIKDLHLETKAMIQEAEKRGERDRQLLIEEGKKTAAEINRQVQQGLDIEVRKAKSALREEAALLSLSLAEGKIKKTITNKDHERLLKESIKNSGSSKS
ncbi:MAG: ATP synthase F0 subunit B [Nitrospirota bacterium]